jgi:predicted Zn-dependent protease
MKKLVLLVVLAGAACDSVTVPARPSHQVYDYRLLTPAPRVLRWPIGSTARVYAAPDVDAARTAQLQAALQQAIAVWNAAALYGEVQLQQTTDVANADAVLLFSSTSPPVNLSGCPRGSGLAITTFCLDAQDQNRLALLPLQSGGGRVKFLVTVSSVVTDEELVRRLVTHELGHVLGIGQHSPNSSDLMYGNTLTTGIPSAADRATLQLLYHTQTDIMP